ncbi:hypothetical protein [Chryseobacterium vrystaatense]|uniref:Uncharacterized protein n=1 Tax=Chryseobacterium vrystaatense TaxID=307480 RepID=A0ABR4UFT3_9FLAO|nr:hypothetical protein [Chryseobacterium vrystaatense]KFF23380.1 hypothetical protein IW16_24210 [Chryseobacterium vrystaatense]
MIELYQLGNKIGEQEILSSLNQGMHFRVTGKEVQSWKIKKPFMSMQDYFSTPSLLFIFILFLSSDTNVLKKNKRTAHHHGTVL